MKKKLANDEIDLIDVFQIIWKKKKNVILSVIISLFLAVLIQISTDKFDVKKKIKNMTDIKAIKMVDESKYEVYNSVLNTFNFLPSVTDNTYVGSKKTITLVDGKGTVTEIEDTKPKEPIKLEENSLEINKINKKFLFQLFVEEVSERSNLRLTIKKFNFIKKENYPNKIEYEKAIDKMLLNIKISNIDSLNTESEIDKVTIEYETPDVERWKNFLKFLEQETNSIIQTKLLVMFNDYLNYLKMIKSFKVEDLESALSVVESADERRIINQKIINLKSDKFDARIRSIFNSSPMSDKEKFYAAKINYESTRLYEKTSNQLKNLYVTAFLLGGIFGIFFVLIQNAVQKRS